MARQAREVTPVSPREENKGAGVFNEVDEGSDQEEEKVEEEREPEDAVVRGGEEGEEVGVRRAPNQPSEKELQDHMVSHVPFRPWCFFAWQVRVRLTLIGRGARGS